MATRAASPDRVFAIFCDVSRSHAICIFLIRGDSLMKGSGMLVGNFELNLLRRPTWAWASLLLTPKRDKFQHSWLNKDRCHFVLKLRCGGLFMLKVKVCSACCAKDMTRLILKTSRKLLTRSPVNDFAQKSLKITAVRHNIWTQFQRRCYRGFPCFREPLTNAK